MLKPWTDENQARFSIALNALVLVFLVKRQVAWKRIVLSA